MKLTNNVTLLVTVIMIVAAGIGVGFMITGSIGQNHGSSTSSVYDLNLVITTNNYYNNSTGDQPAYFVLGQNGLESSANISIPAFTLIDLTIFNYDNGNGSIAGPQYANVTGTVGGTETYFNNTLMNATDPSNTININGSITTKNVSESLVAHTFTILSTTGSVLVNVPVPVSSVVHALFYINQTGTFNWQCEVDCGSGPTGWGGAMATPGWMMGSIKVSL
jgi:heme/copper-type cytochrome/quinol oxidase subunit 2